MKTYEQDAKEIMARAKDARRKQKNFRMAAGGILACALLFAAALGIWRAADPADMALPPVTAPAAAPDGTGVWNETGAAFPDPTGAADGTMIPLPGDAAEGHTGAEIASELPWAQAPCAFRYPSLSYGGANYTNTGKPIDVSLVGDSLGTAEAVGYDGYTNTEHADPFPVYEIVGVKTECAVAATLTDGSTYAYVNAEYTPATLGQFISDLDLKNKLTVGEGFAYAQDSAGHNHFQKFADFDDALLWERLLADESIPNEPDADWGSEVIGFSANVKALGIVNHSVWLTENGYIVTNLLDTAKCFYIGPDAVNAFIDFMRASLPYEEQVNVTFAPGEGTPE